jgi:hypothetical protein
MKTREFAVRMQFVSTPLIILITIGISLASVCIAQSEGTVPDIAPRTLELLDVGYKLPIEIVSVRNLLKTKHWLRDLELEIKNISDKPIYGVYFVLSLPDDKGTPNSSYGVHLEYGQFFHPGQPASADGEPIATGETILLKVDEPLWRGYENHLARGNVPEQASYKVRLTVLSIDFGDGTGFFNGGVPYPRNHSEGSRPQKYVRIPVDSK